MTTNQHKTVAKRLSRILKLRPIRSVAVLSIASAASLWGACGSPPYGNGYSYCRELKVAHALVPNTDQTDFPIPFIGTFSYLRSTANGGHVQSASGYDIIFTSDNAGASLMNWEEVNYTATTGDIERYVKGTVTTAADFTFYLFYGKAGVVSSQSPGSPWNAAFKAVYHFGSASSLAVTDSTGVNNGTNHGVTATAGVAGGGGNFVAGSSQYVDLGNDSSIEIAGPITLEAWDTITGTGTYRVGITNEAGPPYNGFLLGFDKGVPAMGGIVDNAGAEQVIYAPVGMTPNLWYYHAFTYDGTNGHMYQNASAGGSFVAANAIGASASNVYIAHPFGAWSYWDGNIDEVRISNTARSADWIATTFNSLASPRQFVIVGAQTPAFTTATACGPTASGYTYCKSITIDHTLVGAGNPTNQAVAVCFDATMGANCLANDGSLATVANGGKLQNASGYDMIFTSDQLGATTVPYERVIHNLTTGAGEFHVLLNLSSTVDTTFYLFYGNAGVVGDQSNTNGTWVSYGAVTHFTALSGGIANAADSTSNANTVVASGGVSGISGQLGAAMSTAGGYMHMNAPTGLPTGTAVRTAECWVNLQSSASHYGLCGYGGTTANTAWGTASGPWQIAGNSNDRYSFVVTDSLWHHVVATLPSGTTMANVILYLDGSPLATGWVGSAALNTSNANLSIGVFPAVGFPITGYVDEARVSTVARTAGEVTTEYNNLSSPNTFLSISAEQNAAGGVRRKVMMQ